MYIGQTRRSVCTRVEEHFKCAGTCVLLENAIKKYGRESMIVETLIEVNDDMLDYYEIRFIDAYNTQDPFGYNIRSGGSVGKHSAESCKRMSDAKLGSKNHNYGKPRLDSTKLAISLSKSGSNHHFYGKTLTETHKKHLSESHKKSKPELPMYLVYVKERPDVYQSSGYAIVNHPILKSKYFTSKKLTEDEKLEQALVYLSSE